MNKATIYAVFQAALGAVGALLIGHHLWTISVDQSWVNTAVGSLMGVVSVVLGFMDHSETIEQFQAAIRNLMSFLTVVLVAGGVQDSMLQGITGAIDALLPVIYRQLSVAKTAKIIKAQPPAPDGVQNTYLTKLKAAS